MFIDLLIEISEMWKKKYRSILFNAKSLSYFAANTGWKYFKVYETFERRVHTKI